jgi:uncharacterized protein GlcG (DUF336 family)
VFGTAKFITLEAAKRMAAAGEAEARQNGWNVAIAVVDAGGDLILFHKLDETQHGSIAVAQGKARAAALFKRPSKLLEEAIAGGKQALLTVEGTVPMQGGLPVVVEDKVIGAVGVLRPGRAGCAGGPPRVGRIRWGTVLEVFRQALG